MIMNEIFLLLGYSCFVFSVFLSSFVYVLYLIVSMFLSIYTSVSGNFGYFLSVPSIYDQFSSNSRYKSESLSLSHPMENIFTFIFMSVTVSSICNPQPSILACAL